MIKDFSLNNYKNEIVTFFKSNENRFYVPLSSSSSTSLRYFSTNLLVPSVVLTGVELFLSVMILILNEEKI